MHTHNLSITIIIINNNHSQFHKNNKKPHRPKPTTKTTTTTTTRKNCMYVCVCTCFRACNVMKFFFVSLIFPWKKERDCKMTCQILHLFRNSFFTVYNRFRKREGGSHSMHCYSCKHRGREGGKREGEKREGETEGERENWLAHTLCMSLSVSISHSHSSLSLTC